uniref:Uncharacterized protein n=1 Tax=Arion vulgaris TaxID=1028688 RepID=A0A0B6Z5Z3_9EUPU
MIYRQDHCFCVLLFHIMGRYRSDSSGEEYSRKSKKRKKRRSRSNSSSSQHSHISDNRSKKSRRKHRRSSRSRSRSTEKKASRSSRRSRSTSLDRYGSRKQRSDSRSSDRRGSKRSRSPPSKRGRSRSPSSRKRRSWSRSPSRERRKEYRSTSRERSSYTGDKSVSVRFPADARKNISLIPGSPRSKGQSSSEMVPGFSDMTPSEQADERLRQALKAAAAAGEKLKGRAFGEATDSKHFIASVTAIDSDSFVASSFRSSRATKIKEEPTDGGQTHDDAIFGSLAITGFTLTPDLDMKPVLIDSDLIMHSTLYCDPQEKMDKWISRLTQLRRRKLEGEAM